ncbi:hypothetical protein ASZ90_001644 [hydrocarbon metagenome]|uniref:Uncharacterized protein n=1 Tax=hydrocarbon metagenome TaxID=938273 RepID=A0A0W8G5W5_9ZZZZ
MQHTGLTETLRMGQVVDMDLLVGAALGIRPGAAGCGRERPPRDYRILA